jgi:hypothetical protein
MGLKYTCSYTTKDESHYNTHIQPIYNQYHHVFQGRPKGSTWQMEY